MSKKFIKIALVSAMTFAVAFSVNSIDSQAKTIKPSSVKLVDTKGKLKKSQSLALGEVRTIKSDGKRKSTVNVFFLPKNADKSINVTTDKKSVVKLYRKSNNRWDMMGLKEGSATITVKSRIKPSINSKIKIKVKSVDPEEINLSEDELHLDNGEKAVIGAMNKSADINVTFDSSSVDRYLDVQSSDKSIVDVKKKDNKKFEIIGKKDGKATITVASAADDEVQAELEVTVGTGTAKKPEEKKPEQVAEKFDAKQRGMDGIDVHFGSVQNVVGTGNFTVTQKDGGSWTVALIKCDVFPDKKGCTLKTGIPLASGQTYIVKFMPTGSNQALTTEFVASNGKVARLELKTQSVVANMPKKLDVVAYDDKGVDITSDNILNNLVVTVNNGYYNPTNRELTLWTPNTTAQVKITYNLPGVYVNGVQQSVTTTANVSCVSINDINISLDKAAIISNGRVLKDSDWSSLTSNNLTIAANAPGQQLVVRLKGSDGNYYTSNPTSGNVSFSFTSLDPSVLSVTNTGQLTVVNPQAAGKQVYIKVNVQIGTNNIPLTVPVNIGNNAFAANIEYTNGTYVPVKKGSNGVLHLRVIDQFGNNVSSNYATLIKIAPGNNSITNPSVSPNYNASTGLVDLTVTDNGATANQGYNFNILGGPNMAAPIGQGFTVAVTN